MKIFRARLSNVQTLLYSMLVLLAFLPYQVRGSEACPPEVEEALRSGLSSESSTDSDELGPEWGGLLEFAIPILQSGKVPSKDDLASRYRGPPNQRSKIVAQFAACIAAIQDEDESEESDTDAEPSSRSGMGSSLADPSMMGYPGMFPQMGMMGYDPYMDAHLAMMGLHPFQYSSMAMMGLNPFQYPYMGMMGLNPFQYPYMGMMDPFMLSQMAMMGSPAMDQMRLPFAGKGYWPQKEKKSGKSSDASSMSSPQQNQQQSGSPSGQTTLQMQLPEDLYASLLPDNVPQKTSKKSSSAPTLMIYQPTRRTAGVPPPTITSIPSTPQASRSTPQQNAPHPADDILGGIMNDIQKILKDA